MTGRTPRDPEDRIVCALDFESGDEARGFMDRLSGRLRWAKIGLELFSAEGPSIVAEALDRGLHVFLDLKLHDIPNTVERAAARAARMGASLLTVHAGGGEAMMAAAARGAASEGGTAKVLAVTVLTSLTGDELPGYYAPVPIPERVSRLARAARDSGVHGVVASPREVLRLRSELGTEFILLTPGIRFEDDDAGDQKRPATPYAAVRDGSDYLVIGRPMTRSPDPVASFERACSDIARALKE